ncbi:MAG: hypothetical protein D6830_06665 [Ignavibacteria bacterium]|nr:MAG: hypothetical protein D6830_06665 [Ignavibacteria bacterium]
MEIYVNQQNPVEKMTMQQIDAIFSNSRRLGYKEDIVFWGQLGAKGKWSFRKINLYGRNNESGTYEFFRQNALKGGTYKEKIVGLATSTALAKSIMMDPYGIGYSGIGFDLPGIKSLAIAETEGMEYYKGTYKNVLQNKYPLLRLLYIYFNKEETKKLSPVIREFLKYILSYEGQEMVVKVGYLPLTYKLIKTEREKLGMN